MKKIIFGVIIVLIFSSIMVVYSLKGKPETKSIETLQKISSEELLPKLEGIWIRKEYIKILKETKSPFQAIQGLLETQINIQKNKENNFEINLIVNYHEGITREIKKLIPLTENKFEISLTTNYEDEKYVILVDNAENPTQLTFDYQKGKCNFIKVQENDEEDFVNKIVLSGEYRDESGGTFIFEPNRTAKWPDESFKYRIGLDFVFDKYNSIWLVDENDDNLNVFYVYEWKDDKLYFYKASIPGEAVVPEDKPYVILEKTK